MKNEFVDTLKELVDKFVKGDINDAQMRKEVEEEIKKLLERGVEL